MALYQVNAGDRILAVDINQFYNLLKGVAASGESTTLIYNGTALIFQPSSDPSAGTRVLDIKNAAGTHLASLDFNGVLELLAAAAAPGGAVAGALYWDTLLSYLRVHDGTNWRELQTVYPNLVLNSDFGRRTVFGLAMPETFSDTSGYTLAVDAGADPTVGSNILTMNTASHEIAWPKVGYATFWRDGRASATFKAVSTTGLYDLRFRYVDGSNHVIARMNNGTFSLTKNIASTPTIVASVAQALTLNRWYWLEIEAQGTTFIVKIYDTGGTVPGVTKASSTLLQTLSGTVADAAVVTGGVVITTDQSTGQWGGIATGNGGVYVETWLPESWAVSFVSSTLGGQAIGFDETADAGPLGKQWAVRVYIPATNRQLAFAQPGQSGNTAYGTLTPSVAYNSSTYYKVSGKGGSGVLMAYYFVETTAAGADGAVHEQDDASSTSWARLNATSTIAGTARGARVSFTMNPNGTATGTAYFMLPQLELGSAATAWRNAPADDAPIVWQLLAAVTAFTTTSTSFSEVDPRDYALNAFLPWDAMVTATVSSQWNNNTASDGGAADVFAAGSSMSASGDGTAFMLNNANTAALQTPLSFTTGKRLAAGKTRLAVNARAVTGGTLAVGVSGRTAVITITATRGK